MARRQEGRILKRYYPDYYLDGDGNGHPVKNSEGRILKRNQFEATLTSTWGNMPESVSVPGASCREGEYPEWVLGGTATINLNKHSAPSETWSEAIYGPGVFVPEIFYYFDSVSISGSGQTIITRYDESESEYGDHVYISTKIEAKVQAVYAPYYDDPETFAELDYFGGAPYKDLMERVEKSIGRWCVLVHITATTNSLFQAFGYIVPGQERLVPIKLRDGTIITMVFENMVSGYPLGTYQQEFYAAFIATQHRIHDGITFTYFEKDKTRDEQPDDEAKYGNLDLSGEVSSLLSSTKFKLSAN